MSSARSSGAPTRSAAPAVDASDPPAERILGLDNVPIELPIARVGTRVLAAVVDYVLLTCVLMVWLFFALLLGGFVGLQAGWTFGLFLLGAFLLEYGYFALQEVLWRGQTVGKRWVGTRVASDDGSEAGRGQLVLRNVVRSIDVLIGVPFMAIDARSRRLGDRLAGTLVVRESRRGAAVILRRVPPGWRREEIEVVEAFLERAPSLEARQRNALAYRMVDWVEARAPGFLPPGRDPLIRLQVAFESPEDS